MCPTSLRTGAVRISQNEKKPSNSSEQEYAIFAEGLSRSFGEVEAVKKVSLAIPSGEIYGFLGPNGAGKSTMVRMLVTLLLPNSGRAHVAGFDVVSHPLQVRLRIGVALQETGLDPKQTGRELLTLQGKLYGLGRRDITRRIDELEGLIINIGDAMDRPIEGYSGGMMRRIDLAAALLHQPDILFLDEPTTGLDPASRIQVWDRVRTINEQYGVTVFLTTQYLEEADALADRVGIINQGEIATEGSPDELKRSVGTDVILLRTPNAADSARDAVIKVEGVASAEAYGDEVSVSVLNGASRIYDVVTALSNADIHAQEIVLRTPTLDDVFLNVTGTRISKSASDGDGQEAGKS